MLQPLSNQVGVTAFTKPNWLAVIPPLQVTAMAALDDVPDELLEQVLGEGDPEAVDLPPPEEGDVGVLAEVEKEEEEMESEETEEEEEEDWFKKPANQRGEMLIPVSP